MTALEESINLINHHTCRRLWAAGSAEGSAGIWADEAADKGLEVEIEEEVEASFRRKGALIEQTTTSVLALDSASGGLVSAAFAEHNPDAGRVAGEAMRLLEAGGPAVRFAAIKAGPVSAHWNRDPLLSLFRRLAKVYSELPESAWWREVGPAREGVDITFVFCVVDRGWAGARRFRPPTDGPGFAALAREFFDLDYTYRDNRIEVADPEAARDKGWLLMAAGD